jgi:hypothetical protein
MKRAFIACILGMAPIAAHADTVHGFCGYHVSGADTVYVTGVEEAQSKAALEERFAAFLKNRSSDYKGCMTAATRDEASHKLKAAMVEAKNRGFRIIILAIPLMD